MSGDKNRVRAGEVFRFVLRQVLDFALPPRCAGCGTIVADLHKADLQGRTVVLVDDVLTTGSTANACARALRQAAGAGRAELVSWARVIMPMQLS